MRSASDDIDLQPKYGCTVATVALVSQPRYHHMRLVSGWGLGWEEAIAAWLVRC